MKKHSPPALTLILALLLPAAGQQPATTQTQDAQRDREEVVRITSNLVQVDAVVTDRKGQPVSDLRPEEFEIYEDGHQQKITNFSFVATGAGAAATEPSAAAANSSAAPVRKGESATPVPPVRLRPEDVRRTFALVVDDLGLSFESMHFVRAALRKFVDEQMQPGDLVAIIRTGAGVGALQQFTSDKRLLYAAIDRVKWNSRGRAGVAAFAPIESSWFTGAGLKPDGSGGLAAGPLTGTDIEQSAREQVGDFKDQIFSVGTLGAINYVIRGLRELPGRKSVVLLSDSVRLFDSKGEGNFRTIQALRRLTDLANRASVVVYTIDPRGLPYIGPTSADDFTGAVAARSDGALTHAMLGPAIMDKMSTRQREYWDSQEGLGYLAKETGGVFFHDNNDLNRGIQKALDDSDGYYLIGYRPDESTFDPKTGQRRFHNISVKVTRPGLVVRTRSGFFGVAEEDARPLRATAAQQLMAAITSPFESGAVDLRLTSIFLNDPQFGPFMRSFIYVDGASLSFQEQPDGSRRASVDVLAVTFDDQGTPVDMRSRTESVVVRGEEYRRAVEQGLIFGINLPVKRPGAFQLRIAVRDSGSARVGSANQFIEVPDVKKGRLTLSGIYLAEREGAAENVRASTGADEAAKAEREGEGKIDERDPQSGPAVRRFQTGALVEYGYEVYNARLDKATRRPQLQSQVRLFRDNKLAFAGKVVNLTGKEDARRLAAFGRLRLGANLTPGEYVLQVIVTDTLAAEKSRVTAQWIDFEIK
ncbi:MAG TPA: VWA domain-containing protein [Pyrinomonadaceae bacterium]|nr:VWA domain-containing protein [Pyrinomonadaceae bacterium]